MFRKLMHRMSRRGRPARPTTREGRRLFLENLEERSLLSAALPTVTTLATSASAVVPGQSVTLTADVSLAYPNSGAPTDGGVVFKDGTTVLGTEPLVSGEASLNTGALSAGTHLITAQYTGDVHNFAPSTNMIGPGSIIQTVAGGGQAGPTATSPPGLQYGDGGPAIAATLLTPGGTPAVGAIAVDSGGDIFIAGGNVVREVNAQTGIISTVAGTWAQGYSGDGGPATAAELNGVGRLAVDSTGDLFIADSGNDAVREVNLLTGIITTIAGGDTGINVGAPAALALDGSGDLFIASSYGNGSDANGAYSAYAIVRELNLATATVSVVAGNGTSPWASGQSNGGDGGQATAAELGLLGGIAVDNSGHLFIGDSYDCVVREVNLSTGIITTAAGDWEAGALGSVTSLAVDGQGHLFIAEVDDGGFTTPWGPFQSIYGNVQELDLGTGAITTLAGGAAVWQGPPSGPASAAYLSPAALSLDSNGDLFVENAYPCTVAEITPPVVVNVVPGPSTIGAYDPTTSTFFLRNSNSAGVADETFSFGWAPAAGEPALVPLSGDWTGQGYDTVGLYNPATGTFFLSTSDTAGNAQIAFNYGWVPTGGAPALVPTIGDWSGQVSGTGYPIDTVGLYDPASAMFFLHNSNAAGNADQAFSFGWGNGGLVPLAGQWTAAASGPGVVQAAAVQSLNATSDAGLAASPLSSDTFGTSAPVAPPAVYQQTLSPQAVDQADPSMVAEQALSSPAGLAALDSSLDDLASSSLSATQDIDAVLAGYDTSGLPG